MIHLLSALQTNELAIYFILIWSYESLNPAMGKDGGSFIKIKYPRIPGHEVIGVVDKLGLNVSFYEVGRRIGVCWPAGITYDGGFADYMVTKAEKLILIQDELNDIDRGRTAALRVLAEQFPFSPFRTESWKLSYLGLFDIRGFEGRNINDH